MQSKLSTSNFTASDLARGRTRGHAEDFGKDPGGAEASWGQSSGLSTLNELWHLWVENKIWIVLFWQFHLTNKILCTINFRNLIRCEYYQCYQTWIGWEYNPYSYFTPGIVSSIWVRNKLFFSNYFISPNKILGTINGKNVSTVNTLHAFML